MVAVATPLRRIEQVRAATSDPSSAYLIRTRLNRLLISLQRSLVSQYGWELDNPRRVTLPDSAAPLLRELASACNEIVAESSHLAQRSEALDERWRQGWGRLEERLARIESLLLELSSEQGQPVSPYK